MPCDENELSGKSKEKMEDVSSSDETIIMTGGNSKTERTTEWSKEQLLDRGSGTSPARTALRSVMRNIIGQHQIEDTKSQNFDKAVTQIMNEFEALKAVVDDQTSRDIVVSLMIENCKGQEQNKQKTNLVTTKHKGKRKQRGSKEGMKRTARGSPSERDEDVSDSSRPVKRLRLDLAASAKTGKSRWSYKQLMNKAQASNPASRDLGKALKIASEKFNVKSCRSENYQAAITDVMNQYDVFKSYVNDHQTRVYLGRKMMKRIWNLRGYYKSNGGKQSKSAKVGRKTKTGQQLEEGEDDEQDSSFLDESDITDSTSQEEDEEEEEKSPAKEDTASNTEDEVSEEDTVRDSRSSSSGEGPTDCPVLSLKARTLLAGHRPIHEWQRLKKMMRLSSDALGLVGLQQEKSLDTVKQILADFPQLQPYVDNVAVQKKVRKIMVTNLKARLSSDRKRLAEFCIKSNTRQKHLKQTNLLSRVKKLTDISALSNTKSKKVPVNTKPCPKKTVPSQAWCTGRSHSAWTKQQLLSGDQTSGAWQHLLKAMNVTSNNLNVTFKSSENYDAAVTQVMNHFAALQPLVNVKRYRDLIGIRMTINSRARKKMVKSDKPLKSTKGVEKKKSAEVKSSSCKRDGKKSGAKVDDNVDNLATSSAKKSGLQREAEQVTGKKKGHEETGIMKECKVKLKAKPSGGGKVDKYSTSKRNLRGGDALHNETTDSDETSDASKKGIAPEGKGTRKLSRGKDEENTPRIDEKQEGEVTAKKVGEAKDAGISNKAANMKLTMKRIDEYMVIRKKHKAEDTARAQGCRSGADGASKEEVECKENDDKQREKVSGGDEGAPEEKGMKEGEKVRTKDEKERCLRLKRKKKLPRQETVVALTVEKDDHSKEGNEANKDQEDRQGENQTTNSKNRKYQEAANTETVRKGQGISKGKLKRNKITVNVTALCQPRRSVGTNIAAKRKDESNHPKDGEGSSGDVHPEKREDEDDGRSGDVHPEKTEDEDGRSGDVHLEKTEDEDGRSGDVHLEKTEDEDGRSGDVHLEKTEDEDGRGVTKHGSEDDVKVKEVNGEEECEKKGTEKENAKEAKSSDEVQDGKVEKNVEDVSDEKQIGKQENGEKTVKVLSKTKGKSDDIAKEENKDEKQSKVGRDTDSMERGERVSPLESCPAIRDLLMGECMVLFKVDKADESGAGSHKADSRLESKKDEVGAEEGGDVSKENQEMKTADRKEEEKKKEMEVEAKKDVKRTDVGPQRKDATGVKLQKDGKKQPEIFEVDTILKYAQDREGGDWYYVKWLGYSSDQNTWEPVEHLSGCSNLLKKFHRQLKRVQQKHQSRKRKLSDEGLVVGPKKPKLQKQSMSPVSTEALQGVVREELKNWAISLNYICTDTAPIVVENDVDFEGPPTDFTYINDYVSGTGVNIPNDPLVGCECEKCSEEEAECCPQNSGVKFAYNRLKHIRVKPGTPIYECNKYCNCGEDCPNRVVQLGRKYPMSIFRTANGRGWGVKTLVDIRRSTFVMEYVGEVITNEEAERRGKEYDTNGRTYLFDLDYNDDDCPFTVDAGKSGNISHFVNHSCEPNLVVYGVWVNCVDPRLPRIALFANRDIKAGEELTFDYQMTGEVGDLSPEVKVQHVACRCGAENCRGYLV